MPAMHEWNDASPVPLSLRSRILWYGGIAFLSLAIAVCGLQLIRVDTTAPFIHANADLKAPFFYQIDALLILPFVKETVETGTHWKTMRLGAPGIQELYDFPVIDHFHFAIIWLMGLILRNPVVVFNLYHLLTYPAAAVTMMAVLRHFKLSMPASAAGGIIYSFLPYHVLRGESHYFLAAYYFVPITMMMILWICRGELPFFRHSDGRWQWHWRNRLTYAAIVISIITATAGAYYAFFACAILVPAAILSWMRTHSYKAAIAAGICIFIMCVIGGIQHLPTFWYQSKYGANTFPTERQPEDAENYGLKLTNLVLPVPGHNLKAFGWMRGKAYPLSRTTPNENETISLGLIGSIGLLSLCVIALFGRRQVWPLGPLAVLTISILVLGLSGGFGSVFNQLVTPQIRCYNRIVVYLAVLTTFAVCYSIDRLFDTRWQRFGNLRVPVFIAISIFAIWDQTGNTWFHNSPKREADVVVSRREYAADREFFSQIEAVLETGNVFNFPYVPYPESFSLYGIESYSHIRGYLHTKSLCWSFGAMKGREVDTWARQVSLEPPEAMMRRLAYRGFDGLFVDKRGLQPEKADAVVDAIRRVLGSTADASSAPIVHCDGQQLFFNLRSYRHWLISQLGAEGFARAAKQEAEQITVLWLKGFPIVELPGREDKIRKCGPKATMLLVNPSDRFRHVRISALIRSDFEQYSSVEICGGEIWSDQLVVNENSGRYEREIVIPPGRHLITFRCTPHDSFCPSDFRSLFIQFTQFQAVPLD